MAEIIRSNFASGFRDLEVFQVAFQLSLDIHKASLTFPKIEQYALADQFRRFTKGICANIAEGFGKQRQSKAEFKRFLSMAMGSCAEAQMWLDYSFSLGYVTEPKMSKWVEGYNKVDRMLATLHSKIKV